MSTLRQYRDLEARVRELLAESGTTAERMKCLDKMDRLWNEMNDRDKARIVGQEKAVAS